MAERDPFSTRADREGNKQLQGLSSKFVYFLPKRLGTERSETRSDGRAIYLGPCPRRWNKSKQDATFIPYTTFTGQCFTNHTLMLVKRSGLAASS